MVPQFKATQIVLGLLLFKCSGLKEINNSSTNAPKQGGNRPHVEDVHGRDDDIAGTVELVDSVLHHLVAALSPFQPSPEKVGEQEGHSVPVIELDKLKNAAKSAGLTDEKANRVKRAATLLDMGYHDVNVLRRAYLEPETSAEYGEWMRKALETRCIDEELWRSSRQTTSATASIPSTSRVDAATIQRLKTAAKLSGLTDKEVEAFAKVIAASKLDKAQMTRLEDAIVHHAPGPVDMKKFMEQLALLRKSRHTTDDQDEAEFDWNNPPAGVDWLFKPATPIPKDREDDLPSQN